MKRITIFAVALFTVAFFPSCKKEVDEPGPIVCFFAPWVPIRVINAKGDDLLDPAKLANGTVEMKWEAPGLTGMVPTRVNPSNYPATGEYFVNAPLAEATKGLTVYFSIKQGDTDTLFIKTADNSSKPYGLAELKYNGVKIEPKMLFNATQYGIEIVKDGAGN